MTYAQHPLSCAFPAMNEDDFQALVDDIDINGQREPVMIFEDMVLDGWHRYSACLRLGMTPTFFKFAQDDPVAFVKSQNLHRRHMTGSQRAAAVVACSEWHPAHREKKVEPSSTLSKTNQEIAKEAGVTVRTVTDAKTAKKAGLIDAVRDGAMTAKEAAKVARGTDHAPKEKKVEAASTFAKSDGNEEQDAVQILSEENDRLNDRLAVAAMSATDEERALAAETIESLRAQVKTLTQELDAVKASRDSYMVECAELKKQCASQRKQIDKLKK